MINRQSHYKYLNYKIGACYELFYFTLKTIYVFILFIKYLCDSLIKNINDKKFLKSL